MFDGLNRDITLIIYRWKWQLSINIVNREYRNIFCDEEYFNKNEGGVNDEGIRTNTQFLFKNWAWSGRPGYGHVYFNHRDLDWDLHFDIKLKRVGMAICSTRFSQETAMIDDDDDVWYFDNLQNYVFTSTKFLNELRKQLRDIEEDESI